MLKEQLLREALIKIIKVASEQNIRIDSISLPISWSSNPIEILPVEILGIKINK